MRAARRQPPRLYAETLVCVYSWHPVLVFYKYDEQTLKMNLIRFEYELKVVRLSF